MLETFVTLRLIDALIGFNAGFGVATICCIGVAIAACWSGGIPLCSLATKKNGLPTSLHLCNPVDHPPENIELSFGNTIDMQIYLSR
jgi:hypothetical protein